MADPIRVVFKNLGVKAGASRAAYEVSYEDGTVLLERCKDPLTDGARAIMKTKQRWPKDQEIELVGGRGAVLMRAGLRWAANHVVSENSTAGPKFANYVPFDPKTYKE